MKLCTYSSSTLSSLFFFLPSCVFCTLNLVSQRRNENIDLCASGAEWKEMEATALSRIAVLSALLVVFSLSTTLFFVQNVFHVFAVLTPTRCFFVLFLPITVTAYGLLRGSLSPSGAFTAVWVGIFLTLAHTSFLLSLLAFFLSSSKATKFREESKRKLEKDFQPGGKRNWIQVRRLINKLSWP